MKIPCEIFVRAANIVRGATEPVFQTVRLDNGCVVASDRLLMTIDHVPSVTGVHHVRMDDAFIEQCRTEAAYNGAVEIVALPGVVMCKTTFGYQRADLAYTGPTEPFDHWREIVDAARVPLTASSGVMVWNARDIERLAASSPSGIIEFSRWIDAGARATVVRDCTDGEWLGLFMPRVADGIQRTGAVVPGWLV